MIYFQVEAMANVTDDTSLPDDPAVEIPNTLSLPTDSKQMLVPPADFLLTEANHTFIPNHWMATSPKYPPRNY